MPLRSPYEVALGERLHELHPTLQRYFSAIPEGCVGIGEGVFAEFGTERRWLWPFLRPFERRGVLFAGYERSVRFRVVNRTVTSEGAVAEAEPGPGFEPAGGTMSHTDIGKTIGLAVARRELDLPGGTWVMTDSVANIGTRVVDRLGTPQTVSALFDIDVREGALTLTSRRVGLKFGRLRVRIPRWCAPIVRLTEQFEPISGLQRVELTLRAPLIGQIYGYRGHFEYGIVKEQQDGK